MIGSLPLFHRVRGTRVVVVGEGEMGEAKRRLVERAGGIPCEEPEAHLAKLAFIALDDEREAEATARRLRGKGLLVNVADRPELCEFTTPSILDREPVLIAVSTSGASAGLAKHLRLRLERILPQTLGQLAAKLRDARDAMRKRFPAGDERRRAVDSALGEGGILDPFDSTSASRVESWLEGDDHASGTEPVTFISGSDDPEDLTLRQARLLGIADAVLYDPRIPAEVLDRSRADALRRTLPHEGDWPDGLVVILKRE
ncbi:NAD(P)-dependent oxidoreductase [Altererythrobacter sp.]|nr:NAD(P)-dependent oxidoreductase [Altererythrobacter sp.]